MLVPFTGAAEVFVYPGTIQSYKAAPDCRVCPDHKALTNGM